MSEQQHSRNIEKHLTVLTEDIGERLAGSDSEEEAASYIAEVFSAAGAEVHTEPVPVLQRCVKHESLEIRLDGTWQSFPCSLFSSTPGTEGEEITAPLVLFEAPTAYQLDDLSFLEGKAVLHLGCHIESREAYRRLIEANPACLLFVDVRYPGDVPLADGMFPSYTRDIGAKPTLDVAYMDAWEWVRRGADAARIRIDAAMTPSSSQNVVAEFTGSDPEADILFCGGHHDTQAGTVGADDNASGVVTLLDLARHFTNLRPRRTIRLISFGAEEQLSVGSAHYVRQHRREVETRGRFMFNLDSCGSLLGWNELNGNGPDSMIELLKARFMQQGITLNASSKLVPYTDQFPFAVAGVPGVWFGRKNCAAGCFYHHRPDDTKDRLSCDILAANAAVIADLMRDLSTAEAFPFASAIPAEQRYDISTMWQDLYGGWEGLS